MRTLVLSLACLGLAACAGPAAVPGPASPRGPGVEVLARADLEWSALNPARGDASPRAATLWGDRSGEGASGFLVAFVDGFSSPPHIHNVSYRAIVIEGEVFNEDADAAREWMAPGSFWTQPAGDGHITAARGASVVYVEIDEGPYLVKPLDEAFDNGEAPLNLHASAIDWQPAAEFGWSAAPVGTEIAALGASSGPMADRGVFVRLPAGVALELSARGPVRVTVVSGQVEHPASGSRVHAGAYLGGSALELGCEQGCSLYVRGSDLDISPIRGAPRP